MLRCSYHKLKNCIMSFVHIILASSNVFAVFPFMRAGNLLMKVLVTMPVMCSVAMHITETKHGLDPGPTLRQWSTTMLNIDRISAIGSSCIFGLLWLSKPTIAPVIIFIVGGMCSMIGELTKNQMLYTILHMIWHISAYMTMYYIME